MDKTIVLIILVILDLTWLFCIIDTNRVQDRQIIYANIYLINTTDNIQIIGFW